MTVENELTVRFDKKGETKSSKTRRLGRRLDGVVIGKFGYKSVLNDRDLSNIPIDKESCGVIIGAKDYGAMDMKISNDFDVFYKGINCVVAMSFDEEHRKKMVGQGVIPFIFAHESDHKIISEGDRILLDDLDLWEDNYLYSISKKISVKLEIAASHLEKELLRVRAY